MVGQQCSESLQQWVHTQPQVKSFLAFSDGIHSNSFAVATPNRCSSKEIIMSIEWAQTVIFLLVPFAFLLLLIETEDDDEPPDGGLMTPVFQGTT